jgi:tetratricopeptide (TPR) repeat protein
VESALATGADASSPEVLEARSLLARRGGRYDEAISWLNAALAAGAGESPTRLEIGNLLFLQDRFAQAAAQYERAAAADPADPRPWLNLHVASLKRLALAEADRALDKARSLDSSSLSRLQQAQEGDAGTLLPVTAAPTGAWMRRAVWASTGPAAATWPTDLWQALVFPAPWLEPAFLGAAALLGAWILGTRGAQRLSRRCPSCGASVCPRCGRRVKGSDHCPACWSMLTQKGGDSAERARRQQLMAAWRLRAAFWRRVAAALVPGWGDFAFERSPWFLAVGVLWAGAAGAVVAHALYPAPWLPWGGPGFPWFGTLLVTCAHLYGLRRAMSRRPLPGRG